MITKEDVFKLARLSRLLVNDAEATKLLQDLNSILGYVARLEQVDVSKVEPMSHVHGSTNVFREDAQEPSLPSQCVVDMAPDHSGRFIRVPIVIDQSGEN